MEFLVAGYEILEQKPGIEGIYEQIEIPGRTCYGSLNRIKEGSAEPFVNGLMSSNHGGPLEHGTVYLSASVKEWDVDDDGYGEYYCALDHYRVNPYSKVNVVNGILYVTTNYRVLFENGWLDDLKYWTEPTQYHEKRYSVRFTVDRFTGEEFLRHRKNSFNRESTRYVLFTKEKFGNGSIKYIVPVWMLNDKDEIDHKAAEYDFKEMCNIVHTNERSLSAIDTWLFSLKAAEWAYSKLVNDFDWTAEMARTVLPCAINSPLIVTGFESDWIHFFNLRAIGTTGKPHPQAKELAWPLMEEFINRGYIPDITKELIKGA